MSKRDAPERDGREHTFDELRDAPTDERDSFTVRIRADGPDFLLELLRAVEHVLRPLAPYNLRKRGVLHECGNLRRPGGQSTSEGVRTGTHLSRERERRLVESLLLGVPDVG